MTGYTPFRVLVTISDKSAHWDKSWDSTEELIPLALQVIQDGSSLNYSYDEQPQVRLLAKKRWINRVFFAFDVSNTAYDPEKGHLPEHNTLPVVIVRLSRDTRAYKAGPPVQNQVNDNIGWLHNANGKNSLPPFVEDYTLGVQEYGEPRDVQLLLR